jgi:digeranylgeranylglycerophospholipid reductase
MFDVVVVGAGPCGSSAARRCAEYGLKTLLIEEHGTIGQPVQCAGLLSLAAFSECEVSDVSILHEVRGARVDSGKGSEVAFDAGERKAVVVDRGILDHEMAKRAAHAGAELLLKTYVRGIDGSDLITTGINGKQRIPFRILIAADGPRSRIARSLNMKPSPVYLSGIQAEIPHEMDGRYVELYPNASPDFFGWIIPAGEGRARIGLCGTKNVRERFAAFTSRYQSGCCHLVTGTLPIGVRPRTAAHRTLFVGDAGGFVKPTSGGGIYTGLRSAKHAATTALYCIEANDFSNRALLRYERLWKEDIGRELAIGYRLFRFRQQLTASQIKEFCRILNDPGILDTIVRDGDMDHPSELVKKLIQNPVFMKNAGSMVLAQLAASVRNIF